MAHKSRIKAKNITLARIEQAAMVMIRSAARVSCSWRLLSLPLALLAMASNELLFKPVSPEEIEAAVEIEQEG
jgi:hypothetical protein